MTNIINTQFFLFQVIMTDLKNISNSIVVCVEEAPVLKMCFTADQQAIWVIWYLDFVFCV